MGSEAAAKSSRGRHVRRGYNCPKEDTLAKYEPIAHEATDCDRKKSRLEYVPIHSESGAYTGELRECKCKHNKVKGQYRKNGKQAEISENAVSIKIHNDSLRDAIRRMKRLKKKKPKSTDQDYQVFSAIAAWVRPNFGPGNPRTHRLKIDRRTR
jgi:hypothetical protein